MVEIERNEKNDWPANRHNKSKERAWVRDAKERKMEQNEERSGSGFTWR